MNKHVSCAVHSNCQSHPFGCASVTEQCLTEKEVGKYMQSTQEVQRGFIFTFTICATGMIEKEQELDQSKGFGWSYLNTRVDIYQI